MVEALVQWTLLQERDYLQSCLGFAFSKIIGREFTTEFGRIDFILESVQQRHLIVELETALNTQNKMDYCFEQVLRYKKFRLKPAQQDTAYCILFADETLPKQRQKIEQFGAENDVSIKTYSLEYTKSLYGKVVQRLSKNTGLALPQPKNYSICYLRWLHKILKPFDTRQAAFLTEDQLMQNFSGQTTNFKCYIRLALDFEMIEKKENIFLLTQNGADFLAAAPPEFYFTDNASAVNLSNEQKRILLKTLTNGEWDQKVHKVNMYWFMRFVEVTGGNWLPKNKDFDQDKLNLVNGLFDVNYKSRTMYEFLKWCSNYCAELGLVDIIESQSSYNQVILTPLGSEINNMFSLDLLLKKSRLNLNFKFWD